MFPVEHLNKYQKTRIEELMKARSVHDIARELKVDEHVVRDYIKTTFTTGHGNRSHSLSGLKLFTPSFIQSRIDQLSWNWFTKRWYIFAGLALLVFIVYANSLQNAFVSDDLALNYHPLGSLSYVFSQPQLLARKAVYFVVYHLFGRTPWAFRLFNILFHMGSVWLTFVLFWVLASSPVAIIAALLLAVHPITVEAVGWISAGVHPQFTLLLLAALLFYIKSERKMKYFFISFGLFCLAVLVSEKAIMFPLIILLYDISQETVKVHKLKLFLMFGITFVLGLLVSFYAFERLTGLARGHYLQNGFDNPFVTLPVAISSYLWTILWPQSLTLYQTEIIPSIPVFIGKVIGFIAYLTILIFSWKRNRFIFFCLAFFIVALSPMLLPIRIAWIMAERYAYMGSIGIFAITGYLFSLFYTRKEYKSAAVTALVILLSLLAVRSIVRNADWKNEDTLWVATVKASPNSPNAHNNMGDVYSRYGRHDLAAQEFAKAIQLKSNYADAYHNLGNALQNLGKLDEAKSWYEKALAINPNIWQTYAQLATIVAEQEDYEKADQLLQKALSLSPNNPDLFVNLGILYNLKGDKTKALQYVQQGLALNPTHPKGRELLKTLSQ